MKTPKEYNDMIKSGYITKHLLGDVIYSTIKRSQNWGNKRKAYEKYNEEYSLNAKEKELECIKMKNDFFLKINPNFIAKKTNYIEVTQRYHSDPKYDKHSDYSFIEIAKNLDNFEIKDINNFFDNTIHQYVDYVDVVIGRKVKNISYSLNYNVGKYNFYKNIDAKDILKYRELDIVECEDFEFDHGEDILSSQFCKKVHSSLLCNALVIS